MSLNCPVCGDRKLRGGGVLVVVDEHGELPMALCATDTALATRCDWRALGARQAEWMDRNPELLKLMESAVQRAKEMA